MELSFSEKIHWVTITGLKGVRNGASVLGTGAFAAIACALLTEGDFWFVQVLFAPPVLAEVVEAAALVYCRRGI